MKTANREQLVAEWLPQIERWIKGYIAKRPEFSHHYDDFLSDGTVKMIERIDRFLSEKRKFDYHFSCGLRITIMNEINTFLRREYVKPWKCRVDYNRDTYPKSPMRDGFSEDECFLSYLQRRPLQFSHLSVKSVTVDDPPYEEQSPESILFEACKDDTDISIVQGRLDGFSKKEIAQQVGVTPRTVHMRLKNIRERYELAKK